MNLFKKQKQTYRYWKQTNGYKGDKHSHTTIYKIR